MVLVMIALAVGMTIALIFLVRSSTALGAAQMLDRHARARQIAESGLALSIAYVEGTPGWRAQRTSGTWLSAYPLAGGTFTTTAAFSGDDPLTLTVTGHYAGASHVVAARVIGRDAAAAKLLVSHKILVHDQGRVDGFNSLDGPYGGDNVNDRAQLLTNTTAAGGVALNDSAQFRGDLWIGPGGMISSVVTNPSKVSGAIGNLDEPIPVPPVATVPGGLGPNLGDRTYASGTTTLTSSAQYDKFEISGTATVRIQGHLTFLVNKDFNITNSARLMILGNSSLRVYVKEDILFSNDARINNSADPSRLIIYGLGADYEYMINNKASAYAVIDAPRSAVMVQDEAHFHGAVLTRMISVRDKGGMHLDLNPAITEAEPRLNFEGSTTPTQAVLWMEP